MPYVVNQWWASVVAAKQKSGRYLAVLRDRGYPDWTDQYGSLALASSLADDDDPPWGGLPRPTFLVAHLTDDAQRKIFELWARESGAAFFGLSSTVANAIPPSWHETIQHDWEGVIGSDRLDLMVEELRALVALIETKTGRRFDEERLADVMRLANEQAEWNRRTRDLIARDLAVSGVGRRRHPGRDASAVAPRNAVRGRRGSRAPRRGRGASRRRRGRRTSASG